RREAAEDGILAVVGQNLRALLAIVLLQLRNALDDGNQGQPPGTACGEQRQDIKGRHGAQLVAEEHHTVLQLSVVFIRQEKQLSRQILDDESRHEVLSGVLFREDQEHGAFLGGEGLRVNGAVEAEHLLQLCIQKGIQPGKHRGHDGGHSLIGGGQRGAGQHIGSVVLRQPV
ncbi:hypothetical protein LPJCHP_LPJCHP_11635, partial [Dysosmobacter welbionis]